MKLITSVGRVVIEFIRSLEAEEHNLDKAI
jgi:hypothetical protein